MMRRWLSVVAMAVMMGAAVGAQQADIFDTPDVSRLDFPTSEDNDDDDPGAQPEPLPVPTGLRVSEVDGNSPVVVQWDEVDDAGERYAKRYEVLFHDGENERVSLAQGTIWTSPELRWRTQYSARVRLFHDGRAGAWSDPVR